MRAALEHLHAALAAWLAGRPGPARLAAGAAWTALPAWPPTSAGRELGLALAGLHGELRGGARPPWDQATIALAGLVAWWAAHVARELGLTGLATWFAVSCCRVARRREQT